MNKNLKYRLLFFSFLAIFSFSEVLSQSTVKLFNRKNLTGWYAYEPTAGKQTNAENLFHVDKKMIRLYGDKIGYLMSEKSFSNFQLIVEFKWNTDSTFSKKSTKKNSGIMYLVPSETPDVLWPKGIQFQIKEGATGDFVLLQEVMINVNGKQTEAGKSVTSARFADAEKPFGEWNTAVITSSNGKITQQLNGKLVNEGTNATIKEGRILLQYEGYPIDFRKIVLKEIK
jgi:hypothetical protein